MKSELHLICLELIIYKKKNGANSKRNCAVVIYLGINHIKLNG